jgi:Flp pilus assembly protein TadG
MRIQEKKLERGYALVTVAITLFVFLGFLALAVDLGVLYGARTQAQRAADAAALAGAFAFVIDPAPTVTEIRARAVAQAAQDSILGETVTITPADVVVDMVNQTVTVTVERTQARGNAVSTYFSSGIGFDEVDIRVEASAEAATVSAGDGCTKPWVIPNTMVNLTSSDPCQACENQDEVLILNDGSVNHLFVNSIRGQQFMIKPQNPNQALVPSNFYAIEISGTGADDYRSDIARCADVDVMCGSSYNVKNGNMVGPTIQGVQGGGLVGDGGLIGDPPDAFHGIGDYGSNHADTSRSLVVAPIWDSCNNPLFRPGEGGECPAVNVPSGHNMVFQVAGFAMIFVEGIGPSPGGGQGVIVRIIDVFTCGGLTSGGNETGPFSVPVRLVRLPEEDGG